MQIFITMPHGRRMTVVVSESFLIGAVKALIKLQERVPVSQQRLLHMGSDLDDRHTLSHYQIKGGFFLAMARCLKH